MSDQRQVPWAEDIGVGDIEGRRRDGDNGGGGGDAGDDDHHRWKWWTSEREMKGDLRFEETPIRTWSKVPRQIYWIEKYDIV